MLNLFSFQVHVFIKIDFTISITHNIFIYITYLSLL